MEQSEDLAVKLQEIVVSRFPKHGSVRIVFAQIAGSYAFNLNVASSDQDYLAIFEIPVDQVLGLDTPSDTIDMHDPDCAMYEVDRLCRLLLKGNPKVVEPLFVDRLCYQTDVWRRLRQLRRSLLTQVTVEQYVGYARAQVADWKHGKGTGSKKMYHGVRLMSEAKRIVDGLEPQVWMEGPERQHLLAIRRGEVDGRTVLEEIDELERYVLDNKHRLPPSTEDAPLNDWLLSVRLEALAKCNVVPLAIVDSDDNAGLRQMCESLLRRHGVSGRVLCCIPSGSHAYGSAVDESTVRDYIGVYVAPTDRVLSLSAPPKRVDDAGPDSATKVVFGKGVLLFEVGYFCELLLGGSHRLVEALCSDQADAYVTEAFAQLQSMKVEIVPTRKYLDHCTGLVEGQLRSLRSQPKMHTKQAQHLLYHSTRLLEESHRVVNGGLPSVRLTSVEIASLVDIRLGQTPTESAMLACHDKLTLVRELKSRPEFGASNTGDERRRVSDWLVRIRKGCV